MSEEQNREELAGPASGNGLRLAGAPISWGVCEVPGWGLMLPAERVFAEMSALGLRATELGAIGYLPFEGEAIRSRLAAHSLRLVGGFVPLSLHGRSTTEAFDEADRVAATLAAAGAETFVLALVVDAGWSPRPDLDGGDWRRIAANLMALEDVVGVHGLTLALHPHVGTLAETAGDVERLAELSEVGWCLDSGHLGVAGVDPAAFARAAGERVALVHVKDVDEGLAARLRAGELSLYEATRAGVFPPLGQGDAPTAELLAALREIGYEGWTVLELDTVLESEPAPGEGPARDVEASIAHLRQLALATEARR